MYSLSGASHRSNLSSWYVCSYVFLLRQISRVFHAGSAGAHVTGWAQEHSYNHMLMNTQPGVKLKGLHK